VAPRVGERLKRDRDIRMEGSVMANIAVTPEQLQSVASQLNAGAANIESTLSQLAGQVAPLQSEWQGVAQARFQELWAEWQRSSRGIQEALHGISQLTQQAGASYESTEQQIAGSFGR
jgi:6 kDa early secretory antigenic target